MSQTGRIGKRATTISRDPDGVLRVRYHSTNVVTVYPNGRIVLDTGGWRTATTKLRMNQASNELGLGFQVYQQDGKWYVAIDGHILEFTRDSLSLTVRNGLDYACA